MEKISQRIDKIAVAGAAAVMGAFGLLRRRKGRDVTQAILFVIVIGGLLFHLLFEAKSQYILPYFVLLVPMAAAGLHELCRFVEGKRAGQTPPAA